MRVDSSPEESSLKPTLTFLCRPGRLGSGLVPKLLVQPENSLYNPRTMNSLFTFLQTYRSGILLLLLILAAIVFFIQWLAWIFNRGRFSKPTTPTSRAELRFIFSEATEKIINDFRHLLALLIVLIFAFALAYSLFKAASVETNAASPTLVDNMKEALQAVVATLGGLVGSIIGYYFGESSVAKGSDTKPVDTAGTKPPPAVQEPPKEGEVRAPAPPMPNP